MANPHYDQEKPDYIDDEVTSVTIVDKASSIALLNRSEIDIQIATAHKFPRSITSFRRESKDLVTLEGGVAQSCIYALPRAGKTIEGASIRFAEIIYSVWGNARTAARVVDIGDEFIKCEGFFHDLQRNTAIRIEAIRQITNRDGKRYDANMIQVTAQAAQSIAIRNAILRGIPKALWEEMYLAARMVVAGDFKTLGARREAALLAFKEFGVKPDMIYGVLGVNGYDDVTSQHMITLGGFLNSIKEGRTTVDEIFAPENMKKAGEPGSDKPGRPDKSDFKAAKKAKKAPEQIEQKKPDDTKKNEPAAAAETKKDEPKTEEKTASPVTETAKADPGAMPSTGNKGLDQYLDDQAAMLKRMKIPRSISDLKEEVLLQINDEGKEIKAWWNSVCDARAAEMAAKAK